MSRAILLAPSADLVAEVLGHLDQNDRDYSGNLVLFPGKRPAFFLRKEIARQVNAGFLPPAIRSIDELINGLYEDMVRRDEVPLEYIDAVALLFEIHLAGDRSRLQSLDELFPLGLRLYSELEDLMLACLTPDIMRERLSEIRVGGGLPVLHYFNSFYSLVEERGYSTRASRYRGVADRAEDIDVSPYKKIIIAGLYAPTAAEVRLFRHLHALPQTIFLFQHGPGIQRQLTKLGIDPEPAGRAGETPGPACSFTKTPDDHGQVFALSAKLRDRIDAGDMPDERTVVVLPSPQMLFPVLRQPLALLADDSYNISMGYPVVRTPVFGFLKNLLALASSHVDDMYGVNEYLTFVLHPYTKNIRLGAQSETTRILFHSIEDRCIKESLKKYVRPADIEADGKLMDRVRLQLEASGTFVSREDLAGHLRKIHDKTFRMVADISSIGDLAGKCCDVLDFICRESTAPRHPMFPTFYESVVASLRELSSSLLNHHRFTDLDAYARLLEQYLSQCSVPFPGTPLNGMQVLGFLETRNLKFDTVYFLNAEDDVLPGGRGAATILPFSVRASLGLQTYQDRERLMEYYTSLLVEGAKEVHFFFAENNKKEKSRFIEKRLWDYQQRDRLLEVEPYLDTVDYGVSLTNRPPEPITKTEEMIARLDEMGYTASSLDFYRKCKIRFYYERVMGLREREEAGGDIERSDLGTLVHSILGKYFKQYVGRTIKPGDTEPVFLNHLVDTEFEHRFGKNVGANLDFMKHQVRERLHELCFTYHQEICGREQVEILGVEEQITVNFEGLSFAGRIDHIERRNGRIAILDYKIGADEKRMKINFEKIDPSDPATWQKAVPSLQLAVYALLYALKYGESVENVDPAFLLIGKAKLDNESEARLFDEGHPRGERFELLKKIIREVVREIRDPDVAFTAPADLAKTCPGCPYQGLCGTQWVKERRERE